MFINNDWISCQFSYFYLTVWEFLYVFYESICFLQCLILIHLNIFTQKYLTSLFCFFKHIFMIYFLMNTIIISFDIQKKFKFKIPLFCVVFKYQINVLNRSKFVFISAYKNWNHFLTCSNRQNSNCMNPRRECCSMRKRTLKIPSS